MTNQQLREQVKQIYDRYRTALLSKKYYAHRLTGYERCNIVIEVLLALTASSAIGSWWFWKGTAMGSATWSCLGMITAVLAVLKPFLSLTSKIERSANLYASYALLHSELHNLVDDMRVKETLTDDMLTHYRNARERMAVLVQKEDPKPHQKLARKYYEEVKREIPVEKLWMPPA